MIELDTTTEFTGWPSGDYIPLIEVDLSPNELTKRFSIEFCGYKDDLGSFLAGHFYDADLGPVVFMKYKNSPAKGTIINVDSNLSAGHVCLYLTLLLKLEKTEVLWTIVKEPPDKKKGVTSLKELTD